MGTLLDMGGFPIAGVPAIVNPRTGAPFGLHVRRDDMVAVGSETAIVLDAQPFQDSLVVIKNGSILPRSAYTATSPIKFVFSAAPTSGDAYTVYYLSNSRRKPQATLFDSGDTYFSSVVALLHMDGTNGSTTFTDVKGNSWTAHGGAAISTAQSVAGGASGHFNGGGDYISVTGLTALGSGDFTIEGWFRADNIGTSYQALVYFSGYAIYINGSQLIWYDGGSRTNSATLSSNTWYHFATTRQGGLLRQFIDGVKNSTDPTITTNYSQTSCYIACNNGGGEPMTGYVDEVRITVGVARYIANFTPPTPPFSNQ